MRETPDRWVVLSISGEGVTPNPTEKVFAGWHGGYLGSDEWRLSSGITKTETFKDRIEFTNQSGSVYVCRNHGWGMTIYMEQIYAGWLEKIKGTDITITIREHGEVSE